MNKREKLPKSMHLSLLHVSQGQPLPSPSELRCKSCSKQMSSMLQLTTSRRPATLLSTQVLLQQSRPLVCPAWPAHPARRTNTCIASMLSISIGSFSCRSQCQMAASLWSTLQRTAQRRR
ncbi:hypothetical protein K402DRAFT_70768 [Aulographum hederae CBS 113979]|uniref:Uncharacterized protein n=1 Tax=Aulographum hederae CBS 113979 TaxID=1176131 RepID=A0A6G1HFX3_9PEZI|nr:hypothetical protein K402DRAFT_70768 [Aulographum hederae CBS 113979]